MKLSELLSGVTPIKTSCDFGKDIEITKICHDSREVNEGSLFIAIEGFKADGHRFIEKAISSGAKAVVIMNPAYCGEYPYILVEDTRDAMARIACNFYDNPSQKFMLVGVTGTNGKTSVTYLLKAIMELAGKKVGLIGTNQNMIGDKVLETERTTPESTELQKLFDEMQREGADFVVMEVSSHALYLKRTKYSDFDVGIFTNLTQDHLDFHKTMENYLAAKAILFESCKAGILNKDDPAFDALKEKAKCEIITYAIDDAQADVMAKNVKIKASGVEFEMLTHKEIFRTEIKIPGRFSVYNALAAAAAARVCGVPEKTIVEALSKVPGVKGRCELLKTPTDYRVIIDYAHTPDGIYNILNTVKEFCEGRIITVFGCGGDRDKTKRPKMGEIACGLSDIVIVTSDNPRTEVPGEIIKDILEGIKNPRCELIVMENRKEAIFHALSIAQKDDVIVLAGKGHETYQILNDKTIHFDEREVVSEYFK